MKKIFIRSPYFIEVNEPSQAEVKLEIYLWNKGTTEPTTPSYTITEKAYGKVSLNVSNYAKDFIKPIAPIAVLTPTEENTNTWCFMRVVSYADSVEVADETFVCLNGYTNYLNGYNQYSESDAVFLFHTPQVHYITADRQKYINVFIDSLDLCEWNTPDGYYTFTLTEPTMYKLPLNNNSFANVSQFFVDTVELFKVTSLTICEPIYTPIICKFINRFGGWSFLTFFKANQQSVDISSKDYNLLPSNVNYNTLQGQKQRFNFQGKQKIKCNTGWVDENYSELIQDLFLSEVVILDNKPAIVKSQSFEIKTHLKDKNINYEVEFELNFGLINDVI